MFKKREKDPQFTLLNQQILEIQNSMKKTDPTSEEFQDLVSALKELMKIRQEIKESNAKCIRDKSGILDVAIKAFGVFFSLGVTVLGLKLAYNIDQSDEIVRNKATAGIVGKLFPPRQI